MTETTLSKAREWLMKHVEGWINSITYYLPDEYDIEEPGGILFEELPEALGDYPEGTLQYDIIVYRLKHGIVEDQMGGYEDWVYSEPYLNHIRKYFENIFEYGDEHNTEYMNAVLRLRDLYALACIIVEDEKVKERIRVYTFPGLEF